MSDAPQKPGDTPPQPESGQEAKPSLRALAEKDGASDRAADDAAPSEAKSADAKAADAQSTGGKAADDGSQPPRRRGLVWTLATVIVVGGALVAGWPYIGAKVQPAVSDLRELMGLGPRPTQVSMPATGADVPAPDERPEPVPFTPQEPASLQFTPPDPDSTPPDSTPPDVTAQGATLPGPGAQPPVATGQDQPAPAAVVTETTAALAARLEALESQGQGADIRTELARVLDSLDALKAQVAALSERIVALEDGARADPTAPAQALVLAATQVRARLMGDGPFAAELNALEQIAGQDPAVRDAIARLRPHADVGVPTEAALTARFAKVAKAIMTARTTGEAEGWLGRIKDGLGGLVVVRRTDPAAITDQVERAVAVAEAALELGQLGQAVEALSGLEGAPGAAAAAWLGDARARVQAEAALEELHRRALTALSAAGGG